MAQKKMSKDKKDFLEELKDLINKDGSNVNELGDILKGILEVGLQRIMELERDEYVGVESYERSEGRKTYRNGYKPRRLRTRLGDISLEVPQTRDGQFYPSILEQYQRSEKALVLALAEAYINGVSTRKMKRVTEQLIGKEFSSETISRYCRLLDEELDKWRNRALTEEYVYVIVDARYDKCRFGTEVSDISTLVAIGIDVSWGESHTSWDKFIGGLKNRGLTGIRLIVSDNHSGIRHALKRHYTGVSWQRCQRHFMENALDKVPKRYRDELHGDLWEVWSSQSWGQAMKVLEQKAEKWSKINEGLGDFISEEGIWYVRTNIGRS